MMMTASREMWDVGAAEINNEIKKLSSKDKLRLIEVLWDSISREELAGAPLTEEEFDELDRRVTDYRDNPGSGIALEDIGDVLGVK